MWRKILSRQPYRHFSSSSNTPDIPTLYSFLQPSIFALKRDRPPPPPESPKSQARTLILEEASSLETKLHKSLITSDTDEAWKSFKTLASRSALPGKPLTNSLISHLSSRGDVHSLKRAFASAVYVVEKDPNLLEFETVESLLESFKCANTPGPAFGLIKCMFKNRFFVPFKVWGHAVVEISRRTGNFTPFLRVFEENCRIALDEKLDFMKPDLAACNAALEVCCRRLKSLSEAERVVETMSVLGVNPNESSFCSLGYLYALLGLEDKIQELDSLMLGFGISSKGVFRSSLISGYVKSGNLEFVSATILRSLREDCEGSLNLSQEIYCEVVKGFIENGAIRALASLIIEAQKLETFTDTVNRSFGYGVIDACVSVGLSDKAHSILDEMNAQEGFLGLGVYLPILKAYCKEHRTAEATQLVLSIKNSGLNLDVGTYDSLIESSMSSQDFHSALSLFRDMREARVSELSASYLTIMTGLMENNRPELMAAFLDDVVTDPRVKIGIHDWNSIIHAFCKSGRLEDARRTFRRMIFLRFYPNEQTYLSMISGYVSAEKYFDVLMLWNDVKRNLSIDGEKGVRFEHNLADAFLYALVKGGFFDAVMEVVEKAQEMKVFVDKWRYKQAFMETHKKLKVSKLRRRSLRKMEALIAFKNWAGLNV